MEEGETKDLYEYLKTQFSDIETCKAWYRKWRDEDNQEIEGFGCISLRAMAAHCSNVLEGKTEDGSGDGFCTRYLSTKYGPEIYMG